MSETDTIDPALFTGVIPYLSLEGATDAIAFYQKAFAAEVLRHMPTSDGRVMHCHLKLHGGSLMVGDTFPEYGRGHQPSHSFTMTLVVDDADLWWDRAVAAGCEITMPIKVEFWGDRYGELKDPFGVRWAINSPQKPD